MKKKLLSGILLSGLSACALLLTAPSIEAADSSAASSDQIKALVGTFDDAFNNHDAHASAAVFTRDAEFIVIDGEAFSGPAAIEQHLTPLFAGRLKAVHRDITVREVHMIRPDTALVVAEFAQTGVGTAPAPVKGLYTWTVVKRGGQWRIAVWQEEFLPVAPPHPT